MAVAKPLLLTTTLLVGVVAVGMPAGAGAAGCGTTPTPEVSSGGGWPLPNGDQRNHRAAVGSTISAGTIDSLEEVWRYPVPGDALFGNLTTNPIVVDDAVYVGALDGSMHSIDLADGERRWAVERDVVVFGPAGVAVGWGKVFGIESAAVVAAHDAATGAQLWTRDLGVARGNEIDMAPMLVGDCVLIATQALAPGGRGTLYALDQATGAVRWQVETVPDDFWGDPVRNHGGGSWYPPSIDVARGTAYWGTSNPWPSPGAPGFPNGSSRPGDNLYTNTALSIDLGTGAMEWYRQAFAHDIFDRDMVLTQLVDVAGGGEVVVHTGKGGIVLGLDPDSGALLWETPVGVHSNDDLTSFFGPLTVQPGVLGGVETPPAAADGTIYVPVMNAPTTYPDSDELFSLNVALGTVDSRLVAIDAATGDVDWDVAVPGDALGAATVVNDLVLTSTYQGLLLAYDRATGAEVWRMDAGVAVNGWPAVVGDTILWPISGTDPSEVLALRLARGASTTSTTVPATTTSTTVPPPAATPVQADPTYTG